MGFYLRKSFGSGPLRMNLSKSGLGFSVGVKGARIGVGPRGSYAHVGRGGLYYRTSLSSTGRTSQARNANISALKENASQPSDALFDNKQIFNQRAEITVNLKKSHTRDWWYFFIGLFSIITGIVFLDPNNLTDQIRSQIHPDYIKVISWGGLLIAAIAALLFVKDYIGFTFLKWKSDRLYKGLKKNTLKIESNDPVLDWHILREILGNTSLKNDFLSHAKFLFYCDYVNAILANVAISDTEAKDLKLLEETLSLDPSHVQKIKRWGFNLVYLKVIEDHFLSEQEEEEIFKAQRIFGLTNDDVQGELETLNSLGRVRRIKQGDFQPLDIGIALQKDELGYHKTTGRFVKDKVVKSFQMDGVRHKITDLVVEREGDLYLTDKRLIIVGDGTQSIRLDKILNHEIDIDRNLISMDIDGRKTPIQLTVPDSLIFSSKRETLKSQAVSLNQTA